MTEPSAFTLQRDAFGRLILTSADGTVHKDVVPVRAFPIAAPEYGLALVDTEGKELVWIEHLDKQPENIHRLLEEALAQREFVPEIRRLLSVSSFITPSQWTVETDRGQTQFILDGEEDIRRLGSGQLLIADRHGIYYLIRDVLALDQASRKLLDRFL